MSLTALDTGLHVASLAERPDLESAMLTMESSWPAYIQPDPILVHWAFERHAQHQLVVLDDENRVAARAASVPLAWNGTPDSLPDTGWDEALRQCMADTYSGEELNTVCALEIAIAPDRKAQNLSARTLAALKDHARRLGHHNLVAPVRPSLKHTQPHLSMQEYTTRTREDGLPEDPWLRVHVREGGQVLKVCPVSMTISGSLTQWRAWTGLPFDTSGPVEVPGALTPVVADAEHDHAVYIEPNVWVRHGLSSQARHT
ncbi:N-acetyltransferase [Streptomyces sp. DSM 42041]|uniref:N-acetyltransferase n=1 Tax=Streptomyces hazeniae TaxID=3075538 RepID=A0ABU2P1R2_9ACTN|nr:N-acetyltransferase [Streptomyces sp. DSM 42041]MDT0382142.1 N-acetyltransferase [Streptomyces sp. DSM 42041]